LRPKSKTVRMASTPGADARDALTPLRPRRSRNRARTPQRTYSRQRALAQEEGGATEEERKALYEHLGRESPETPNRPLSARSRFILGCVRAGKNPHPSLVIRKTVTATLSIASMRVGDDLAVLLAGSLPSLPLLEGLNISDNNLTDIGLVPIVKVLHLCTKLTAIDLSKNKVDWSTANALLAYIESSGCNLVRLIMCDANVDDMEAAKFVHAIAQKTSFREIDMSHNLLGSHEFALNCKETAGAAYANLLVDPGCTIDTLKLAWNMLRFKSGIALARSLKTNCTVTYLDLSYNGLAVDGGEMLGDALHSNRTLRTLKIASNNITSRPCFAILSGLVSCTSLTEVDMSRNPIGKVGARFLLSIELKHGNRVNVDIRGCSLKLPDPSCWYDPHKLRKEYTLHMHLPYERSVCIELLRLAAETSEDHSIKAQYCGPDENSFQPLDLALYFEDNITQSTKHPFFHNHEAEAQIEEARCKFQETANKLFHKYDADASGGLDRQELATVLSAMGISDSMPMVDKLLTIYDTDGSGLVEEDEFVGFLHDVRQGIEDDRETAMPKSAFMYNKDIKGPPCVYLPPDVGTVTMQVVVDASKQASNRAISKKSVEAMLQASKGSEDRGVLFEYALAVMKLKLGEAQTFYRVMLKELGSAHVVLQKLLPRMASTKDARLLISSVTNNDFEQMHALRTSLGPLYYVYLGIPNAFYRLNMGEPQDRLCLNLLVELGSSNAARRKLMELGDTSQCRNWLGFRNSVFEGKRFDISVEWLEALPEMGRLEFDFVSFHHTTASNVEISNLRLFRLLSGLGMVSDERRHRIFDKIQMDKNEGRISSRGTGMKAWEVKMNVMDPANAYLLRLHATYDSARLVREAVPISAQERPFLSHSYVSATDTSAGDSDTSGKIQPQVPKYEPKHDQKTVNQIAGTSGTEGTNPTFVRDMIAAGMEPAVIAERIVEVLLSTLAGRWITCVQLALMVEKILEGSTQCGDFSTYRTELVVGLYSRVVDPINIDFVLKELEADEYALLLFRLGWLNVWSPLKAEGRMTLDLGRPEERQLLRVVMVLDYGEPGRSWRDASFRPARGKPPVVGWELPVTWYAEAGLPPEGIVSLQYFSGKGVMLEDCAPNPQLRHVLMCCVLARAWASDIFASSRPCLENAETILAKMGSKLSFITETQQVLASNSSNVVAQLVVDVKELEVPEETEEEREEGEEGEEGEEAEEGEETETEKEKDTDM